MQITIFGLLVVTIGIWCQFRSMASTIIAMFGLIIFGSASALDLPALGGASVTPANMFLVFYLMRLVSMRDGPATLIAEMGPRRPLFIFLLLIIWICGSAILLPRLFDGATQVFSLSRSLDNDGGVVPLHPNSGNLSQAVYAIGGFLVACATCAFARKPGGLKAILSAIILVTSLHIFFSVLDLITGVTHTGFLLDVVHTASYVFLTNDELGGLKRLSGSFTEASVFASFSLTLLGLNLPLFVMRIRPRFTGTSSVLLTSFVALATSSAGYVGLTVFMIAFVVYAMVAGVVWRRRRVVIIALSAVCLGVLGVCVVMLFLPGVANVAQAVVSQSLLDKGTSDSAIERGSWNTQAWQVLQDTHGLGAGIGTTRGSNYIMVLLSNLGIVGFALFVALILRVTLSTAPPQLGHEAWAIIRASRIAILTALVPNLLIGTVYDLGTLFYCLVGIAAYGIATKPSPTTDTSAIALRRAPTSANNPPVRNAPSRA